MYRFRDTLPIDISEQTISGDLVTINNPEEMGVVGSLEVSLEPIQDLNGYDKPWSGGNGKNKFDASHDFLKFENGIIFTLNNDGSVTANGTATSQCQCYWRISKETAQTLGGLKISCGRTDVGCLLELAGSPYTQYANINTDDGLVADTISSISTNANFIIRIFAGTTFNNVKLYPMIRTASTDATWQPYSNICPISGRTECVTRVVGKNLLPQQSDAIQPLFIPSGTQIFVSATPPTDSSSCVFNFYRADQSRIDYWTLNQSVADGRIGKNVTITEDAYYVVITNATALNKQIELGSTATSYEPYQGTTYTTDLGRTVYGGTLDVVSGVLTVDRGYIASYNGETLPSTWISDRDEYASGTTPTIGAEVVYELATPQTYQLTPQQIELLLGENHLWSDGEISVVWHKDLTKGRILPTEAVSINGQYIENVLDGYRTLYTKGRESLGAELNTYSVGTADGEKFKNKRYPARTITVGFQLIGENPQDFRQRFNNLNNLLAIEEADFIFNDETDKFFSGYPIMDAEVEAGQDSVKGEWHIYCAYPFKRSVEPIKLTMDDATVTDTTATFTIDYKGSRPARPVLRAKFAGALSGGSSSEDGDCGFVAFVDQEENIIQLGNPEVLDLDEYTQAETLINKEFVNVSDWQSTGGHTYKGTVTGSVATSNTTDTYWNGGRGQTQSYAKPTYGSGTGLHGAILWQNTAGAVNFTMDMVHRLCVSSANQTGVFECGAYNHDTGVMVAGFVIDKTSNGTAGVVRYIVNGRQVGSDSIDLSYYNTHFGYCNRTPVYVQQTYYDPVTETYRVQVKTKKKKKKKKKYVTKSRIVWVARTRTVFSNWNYTQSNLNSSIEKEGAYVYIKVGNLPLRTFNVPDVEQMIAHDASVFMGTYGTAMHTNMIHSLLFRREAGVPFAEQPNVFTAGDILEADCNEATVNIYRDGSIGGHLEPQYGALGNDWESFMLTSGSNVIRATWSEWVNPTYKPQIEIEYNEVFI